MVLSCPLSGAVHAGSKVAQMGVSWVLLPSRPARPGKPMCQYRNTRLAYWMSTSNLVRTKAGGADELLSYIPSYMADLHVLSGLIGLALVAATVPYVVKKPARDAVMEVGRYMSLNRVFLIDEVLVRKHGGDGVRSRHRDNTRFCLPTGGFEHCILR